MLCTNIFLSCKLKVFVFQALAILQEKSIEGREGREERVAIKHGCDVFVFA